MGTAKSGGTLSPSAKTPLKGEVNYDEFKDPSMTEDQYAEQLKNNFYDPVTDKAN